MDARAGRGETPLMMACEVSKCLYSALISTDLWGRVLVSVAGD